jgi:hypothetical protein
MLLKTQFMLPHATSLFKSSDYFSGTIALRAEAGGNILVFPEKSFIGYFARVNLTKPLFFNFFTASRTSGSIFSVGSVNLIRKLNFVEIVAAAELPLPLPVGAFLTPKGAFGFSAKISICSCSSFSFTKQRATHSFNPSFLIISVSLSISFFQPTI